MNTISFNGRKDVIYGLKKAADSAKAHEIAKARTYGNAPLNMASVENKHRALMEAYLDTACHDESFINTITHMTKSDHNYLAEKLKSYNDFHYVLQPLKIFGEYLTNAFNKHNIEEYDPIKDNFLKSLDRIV